MKTTLQTGSGRRFVALPEKRFFISAISGGVILSTPTAGYTAPDAASYTLSSDSGAPEGTLETSRFYQVLTGSTTNALDVLRNSPPGTTLVSVTSPAHGTAQPAGTHVFYTPQSGYTGPDAFNVTTSAGTFTVTLDVRLRPNFLFILTDDQGWTSMETEADKNRLDSKSDYHITPNMRRLAEAGMRFSRGYSPHPNCSPSRYSNLTGKTPARLGFTNIVGVDNRPETDTTERLISPGKKVTGIQTVEVTIPELLKTLPGGYAAAHWGKWHVASEPALHGFDEGDGGTGNNEGNAMDTVSTDPKLAYSITQRAVDFMSRKAAAGTPFYCQISHYAAHDAVKYSQAAWDAYNGKPVGTRHYNRGYAAMLNDLDTAIGQTLDGLDDLGLRHSTYVVFQSDNGAVQSYSPLQNFPLRRGKPQIWEGGIRVPTMFSGPGIAPNTQCDLAVNGVDFFPTLWEWAGGSPAALPAALDGGSLVPVIAAVSAGNTPPPVVRAGEAIHYTPHYIDGATKDMRPSLAIHEGDYKLVIEFEKTTFDEAFSLFHLGNHIGETNDLSEVERGILWQLWVRARDYLKQVDALYPVPHPVNWPGADGVDDGDVDNDGLPDIVEIREMLTFAFDGDSDPDQDGVSTADEIAAGTDPLLPNAITISSMNVNVPVNEVQLEWKGIPGANYAVEFTADLVEGDWETLSTVNSGDEFVLQATLPLPESPDRGFFRVRQM